MAIARLVTGNALSFANCFYIHYPLQSSQPPFGGGMARATSQRHLRKVKTPSPHVDLESPLPNPSTLGPLQPTPSMLGDTHFQPLAALFSTESGACLGSDHPPKISPPPPMRAPFPEGQALLLASSGVSWSWALQWERG